VKFTKRIQFGLTPWLWRRLRKEAEQQKVSVNKLVRTAVEKQARRIDLAEN
jgi:predicted HicB family RNase H-like nuclease